MQPLIVGLERAGAVLFVRSLADLTNAIRAVNELLSRRPSLDSPGDDVLGVIVHEDLDANLPKPTYGRACTAAAAVCLRESAALCGIWSLCWFDFTVPEGRADAEHRRSRLLDLVLFGDSADRAAPEGRRLLFPVFTRSEACEGGAGLVDHLLARYPTLAIGPNCYVHDAERRRLAPLAGRHLTHGLRLRS